MFILSGFFIGIVATCIFDIFQHSLFFAYNISKPKWHLVGRYFYGLKDQIYFYEDIESSHKIKYELFIGYFFHYLIGIIYGIIYIILNILFFDNPSLILAIIIGFLAVLGNWCIMMPYAFNVGFFASKKTEKFQILVQNLIAHYIFGIGLYIGQIIIS